MGSYHQMGHHSENLLHLPELKRFSGAILSPVNYTEDDIISQVRSVRARKDFEMIFDPQLYYPRSERGMLRQWSYFPDDVDTADMQSEKWWCKVIDNFASTCTRIQPTSACSPAFAPRVFSNEYFRMMIQIGNYFANLISNKGIRAIQTVVCGLNDLSLPARALEIASIISQTHTEFIYLVFLSSIVPRRELTNTDELKGAMQLISALENSGLPVIVGFSSSDLVLWKVAGATGCSTGKFFNLRRFTSSRFEETDGGGGQLPYWFEESLLAFLRESDLLRVKNANLLSKASFKNPFSLQILNQMKENPGQSWLGLTWRQYLYAFADLESRLDAGTINIKQLFRNAEKAWIALEDQGILMEEIRNNGEWVRSWHRAISELNL